MNYIDDELIIQAYHQRVVYKFRQQSRSQRYNPVMSIYKHISNRLY